MFDLITSMSENYTSRREVVADLGQRYIGNRRQLRGKPAEFSRKLPAPVAAIARGA